MSNSASKESRMNHNVYYRPKGSSEPWQVIWGGEGEEKTRNAFMEMWFGDALVSPIENDHREFYLGSDLKEGVAQTWKKILDTGELGPDEGPREIQTPP